MIPRKSRSFQTPSIATALALFLAAVPLQGQQDPSSQAAPLTVTDLVQLLNDGVSPARILTIVAGSCVVEGASPRTEELLTSARATPEVVRAAARFECDPATTSPAARLAWLAPVTRLEAGASHDLGLQVLAGDGTRLEGREARWMVSDPAILTVDTQGTVTALRPGSAEVVAEVGSLRITARIEVNARREEVPRAARVTIAPSQQEIRANSSGEPLIATVLSGAGASLEGRTVTWEVEDPSVVVVAADGTLNAREPGETRVYATVDGVRGEALVRVVPGWSSRGLHLGVHIGGSRLQTKDDFGSESGRGGGIRVGWGFSPSVSPFLSLSRTHVTQDIFLAEDPVMVWEGELGMRYIFSGPASRGGFFVEGAYGHHRGDLRQAFSQGTEEFTGSEYSFGGGYRQFLLTSVAVDVGLRLGFGSNHYPGLLVDTRTVGINASLTWHPSDSRE